MQPLFGHKSHNCKSPKKSNNFLKKKKENSKRSLNQRFIAPKVRNTLAIQEKEKCRKVWKNKLPNQKEIIDGLVRWKKNERIIENQVKSSVIN